MAEKFTSFNKFHQKIDTELILEDILHVDEEWVIHCEQYVLFHRDIL